MPAAVANANGHTRRGEDRLYWEKVKCKQSAIVLSIQALEKFLRGKKVEHPDPGENSRKKGHVKPHAPVNQMRRQH